MREFFVLSYSDRDDLETVIDYEMGDFDLRVFWSGSPFMGSIPHSVRLWVNKGTPSDYLGNPLSWEIVSVRFWSLIEPLVRLDCQVLPVPLYYHYSKARVPGYLLLNPTKRLSVAKRTLHRVASISELVVDPHVIPSEVNICRWADSSTVILVSEEVVNCVWGKKLKGLAFVRTKSC
jgi:hypothetical protein